MDTDLPKDPIGEFFGEPTYSYSRAQALEDGVLVDVTEWAGAEKGIRGGFKVPVAVTAALWERINAIPKRLKDIEDVRGRAHDVLSMAAFAACRNSKAERVSFRVVMNLPEGRRTLVLLSDCGPGDRGEPVVTIGFPIDF